MDISLILYNIRSNFNVGSAFRTADAAGVSHIYLVGYTPAPVDQFKRVNKELAKVALGAEQSIPWSQHSDIFALITQLKRDQKAVIAVEQDERAMDYKKYAQQYLISSEIEKPQGRDSHDIALIFGNEVEGIEKTVLDETDQIVNIPMRGKKESLNVSVALGIVLFRIADK